MKDTLVKHYKSIIIVLISLLLAGCAFKPRRAEDVPPQLRTLYFKIDRPYSEFATRLRTLLKSLKINLMKSRQASPFGLYVSNVQFSHNTPNITTTSYAVAYTYTFSATVQIDNRDGETIVPARTFSAQRVLYLQLAQIYTPQATALVKPELERDIISQIYYWMSSRDTHLALEKPRHRKRRKLHVPKSTRRTS